MIADDAERDDDPETDSASGAGETGETIGARIRTFRRSFAEIATQKSFSEALRIDQQRLSGYENGTRVPHTVLAALVRMGACPQWLLFGEGPMRCDAVESGERLRRPMLDSTDLAEPSDPRANPAAAFVLLPLYADESALSADPAKRRIEVEGSVALNRIWCPNPAGTDMIRIRLTGRAMEPGIPPGAVVSVDRHQSDPSGLSGRVVAVETASTGVVLRRVARDCRGGWVGVADQPEGCEVIPLDGEARIAGVVITAHKRLP